MVVDDDVFAFAGKSCFYTYVVFIYHEHAHTLHCQPEQMKMDLQKVPFVLCSSCHFSIKKKG